MPPVFLIGLSSGRMTSWPGASCASSACWPMVLPVTVGASSCSSPSSFKALASTAVPPAACRSVATNRPPGLRSHSDGVDSAIRSKSSMSSGTPASRATASRCSTPFVEPPDAATARIAFSSDSRVMMSLGFWPRRSTSITSSPAA